MKFELQDNHVRDAKIILDGMSSNRYLYCIAKEANDKYLNRGGICIVKDVKYNKSDNEFYYIIKDVDTGLDLEVGSPFIYFECIMDESDFKTKNSFTEFYYNKYIAARISLFMKSRVLSYHIVSSNKNNGKEGACIIRNVYWDDDMRRFIYKIMDRKSGEIFKMPYHCFNFGEPIFKVEEI